MPKVTLPGQTEPLVIYGNLINPVWYEKFLAAVMAVSAATNSDIQTLTNKTINGADNTLNVRLDHDVSGNLPVGNLASGSGASSATFWRGDGTWASPPAPPVSVSGPVSSTNNGFAVYNGTTGQLIKDHAATISLASEVSGNLPVANLNGGTGAAATTFWRGDGAWNPAVTNVATGAGLTGGPITGTGTVALASQPAFSAFLSANQTGVPNSIATLVTFNSTTFNTGGFFNTGTNRWTPPSGTITLTAGVYATGGGIAAASPLILYIYKNGSPYTQYVQVASSTQGGAYGNLIDRANGTDFYQVYALVVVTPGTATLVAASAPLGTFFQGSWICP
jgi:hypothetical protein